MMSSGLSEQRKKAFLTASENDLREALLTFLDRFVAHAGDDPAQLWSDTQVSPNWGTGDPAVWGDWLDALWDAVDGPTSIGKHPDSDRMDVTYGGEAYEADTRELARSRFLPIAEKSAPAFAVRGEFDEVTGYAASMEFIDRWYREKGETIEVLTRELKANAEPLWDREMAKWRRLASEEWQVGGRRIATDEPGLLRARIVFADGTQTEVSLGRFADERIADRAWPAMARFVDLVRGQRFRSGEDDERR
ncbi:hypothetical protein [Leifsonia sp. NPDC080035]|uniref:Uncharacterized protein n=1 Tax=Leifsonia sp. NPDC080035 TaxID=3143936 RepID=A0AAU7GG87_9MICO